MKKSFTKVAIAVTLAVAMPGAYAQSIATGTGGAGGAGGTAAGGNATGGVATGGVATGGTATNANNTSGVSNANGGSGGSAQGGSASAVGGSSNSNAVGGNVGTVSTGGSTASLGDVTVNYNLPAGAMGKGGLGVGVDPNTGHVVTDNNVVYSGSYKLKNTPDVNVGGPASGPCNGFSGGIGVSIAGMAIGANASTVDEGCTARETARVAAMIGRMDIANAVLENLPAVQAALRAKSAREAAFSGVPGTASLKPGPIPEQEIKVRTNAGVTASNADAAAREQQLKEQQLHEQQNAAQEALARQATMWKVNDTLKFTDASTQSREKTPQQAMAEEASAKLAAKEAAKLAAAAQAAKLDAGASQPGDAAAEKAAAQSANAASATATAASANADAHPQATPARAPTAAASNMPAPVVADAADSGNAPVPATTAPLASITAPVPVTAREPAPADAAAVPNDAGKVATQSADAPEAEANTGLPSQELQHTTSADDAKSRDGGIVSSGASVHTSLRSSEAKAPDASVSTTSQQTQQLSRVDSTTMNGQLVAQQFARPDGKSSSINAGSFAGASTASTAERVRAAKAAFGFK
jgi:hypothetical protein